MSEMTHEEAVKRLEILNDMLKKAAAKADPAMRAVINLAMQEIDYASMFIQLQSLRMAGVK